MRRFLFCSLAFLLSYSLAPVTGHAAVTSGELIKASGPSVYYFGADGKRYVFPTEKTYLSWYGDFSSVKTISDAELAGYAIGGNVTYRPGVRLVKITTDPKVYAIAANGTLRWIQTEEIATFLYGADWAKKVDDIPDAFFTNYKTGAPITALTDFSPANATEAAPSINFDRGILLPPSGPNLDPPSTTPPTQPAPKPTPDTHQTSIASLDANPYGGKLIGFQSVAFPANTLSQMNIFFEGTLIKNCTFTPCYTEYKMPLSEYKPAFDLRVDTEWITGEKRSATSSVAISTSNQNGIGLTVLRPELRSGVTQEVIAEVLTSDFASRYTDIFMDGSNVHGCSSLSRCKWTRTETDPIGTVHSVYAIIEDVNGKRRQTATQTWSVVDNDHPIPIVQPAKVAFLRDETVDVRVDANDTDGIAWTEIWLNGSLLKHCASASCTMVTGPWQTAQTLLFSAKAQDALGLTATSSEVRVTIQ